MFRVFIYRNTGNLGDAIQTYALCRLLGPCVGVYRDEPLDGNGAPLIANGWLGRSAPVLETACVFAGIHMGENEPVFLRWMRRCGGLVGARDSYTASFLKSNRVPAALVGCATLTLERYTGPRRGRYSIDIPPVEATEHLTNSIGEMTWAQQWDLARQRLDQLRTAEIVYTNRLHVILPCLAFGTPVAAPLPAVSGVEGKSRLTLLYDLKFAFDEVVTMDVSGFAQTYSGYLAAAVGSLSVCAEPAMPVPARRAHQARHSAR